MSQAYFNRAVVYFQMDKPEAAIADFTKYIELNPKEAGGYYERGKVYQKIFEFDKAKSDFEKARELGYQFPED